MECKKCGASLLDSDTSCKYCGAIVSDDRRFVLNESNVSGINFDSNNDLDKITVSNTVNNSAPSVSNKKFNIDGRKIKIGVIILIAALLVGGLGALAYNMFAPQKDSLVCTSDEGNITIYFNDEGLIKYNVSNGMKYDFSSQKETANELGIDEYIWQFNEWFINNTTGKCLLNGEEVTRKSSNSGHTIPKDAVTVGDEKHGYISVPSDWTNYADNEATNSLKYSYSGIFIVTVESVSGGSYTASEYADSFYNEKNSSLNAIGVIDDTDTIGDNIVFKVYYYDLEKEKYFFTYWFDGDDGKLHFISIEGPEEYDGKKITDFMFIPESFSLTR